MKRALRTCTEPGCPALVLSGRCQSCQSKARKRFDERRESSRERGYDRRWEKARASYLSKHPLCVHCKIEGQDESATVLDHKIPHRGNKVLFWLSDNWQGLCVGHHGTKTKIESGMGSCAHGNVDVVGLDRVCIWCGMVMP